MPLGELKKEQRTWKQCRNASAHDCEPDACHECLGWNETEGARSRRYDAALAEKDKEIEELKAERDDACAVRTAANTQLREAEAAWRLERDEKDKRIAELEEERGITASLIADLKGDVAELRSRFSAHDASGCSVSLAGNEPVADGLRRRIAELEDLIPLRDALAKIEANMRDGSQGELVDFCEDCETVSERDALKARVAELEAGVARMRHERADHHREFKDETWHWQDDGEDYPESLACPVIVSPDVVRRWVKAEAEVAALKSVHADAVDFEVDVPRHHIADVPIPADAAQALRKARGRKPT